MILTLREQQHAASFLAESCVYERYFFPLIFPKPPQIVFELACHLLVNQLIFNPSVTIGFGFEEISYSFNQVIIVSIQAFDLSQIGRTALYVLVDLNPGGRSVSGEI